MRSVLKLVSANIRHKKGAFKGIVFLMMLIVFSFTGTVSNKDDLDISINESFDKINCGDLVIRIYSDLVSGKINDTINNHPGISHIEYRDWLFVMQKPLVDGEEKEILIELSPYTGNTMVFNDDFTAFVTEDPAPKHGEIYLPYKMKTLVDKGSEIKIRTSDNTEYVFTVKGYYEDPMYGPIAVSSNCCVISAEDLESIKASSDHITDSAKRILPCT
ncbi:MAG: hypothetical protein ILP19_08195, partial [Oscillospiraceae bacterium]|nr:hypothetical protein [Oscillospiraceae bacterium]